MDYIFSFSSPAIGLIGASWAGGQAGVVVQQQVVQAAGAGAIWVAGGTLAGAAVAGAITGKVSHGARSHTQAQVRHVQARVVARVALRVVRPVAGKARVVARNTRAVGVCVRAPRTHRHALAAHAVVTARSAHGGAAPHAAPLTLAVTHHRGRKPL